jgi:hypothetical protein
MRPLSRPLIVIVGAHAPGRFTQRDMPASGGLYAFRLSR